MFTTRPNRSKTTLEPSQVVFSGWIEDAMAIVDSDGIVQEFSNPFSHWSEKPESELKGASIWDLLEEKTPECKETIRLLRADKRPFHSVLLHTSPENNSHRTWFHLSIARQPNQATLMLRTVLPPWQELQERGADAYLLGDQSRLELFGRALRAEAQLENLHHRWPGIIFSQRPDFSFQFVSPKIEEITGLQPEEFQRQPMRFWQIIHESDVEEIQQHIRTVDKKEVGGSTTFRIRHALTGRISYVLEHRQSVRSKSGLLIAYEGLWLDVTRQIIAEKRLSSAAWKETLATLTMGLAHDFTNVMAGIHSLSESFLMGMEADHPFREGLTLIQKNSRHASELVHRIINLHRGKTGVYQYHNLNELVSEVLDLARKVVPRRIELQTDLYRENLPLYMDAFEFRQVVLNLLLNAVDAMPQTGRLTIRTSAESSYPYPPHCCGEVPRSPVACLTISDTGIGVADRNLNSLFDPFFTTKAMNKGSGLGLYNARLFVQKHHGSISVKSTEGKGTSFTLWLPISDFSEMESSAEVPAEQPIHRPTILLLGANKKTVEETAECLRLTGFHVVTAPTTDYALECLRTQDYPFDGLLYLADQADQELGYFVTRTRRVAPKLKILLKVTGCSDEEVETRLREQVEAVISPDLTHEQTMDLMHTVFLQSNREQ